MRPFKPSPNAAAFKLHPIPRDHIRQEPSRHRLPTAQPIDGPHVSPDAVRAFVAQTADSGSPQLKDALGIMERILSGPQGEKGGWAHALRSSGLQYLRGENAPHCKALHQLSFAERSKYFRAASVVLGAAAPNIGHSKDPARNPIVLFSQAAAIEGHLGAIERAESNKMVALNLAAFMKDLRTSSLPADYIEGSIRQAERIVQPRFRQGAARFPEIVRAASARLDGMVDRDGTSIVDFLARAVAGDRDDSSRPASCLVFDAEGGQIGRTTLSAAFAAAGYQSWSADLSQGAMTGYDIIGMPPSFVTYGSPPSLVNAIRANPRTVVFVSEADRIHPKVADILHTARTTGTITDKDGIAVDCSECVFIDILKPRNISPKEKAFDIALRAHSGASLSEGPRDVGGGLYAKHYCPPLAHSATIATTGQDPSETFSNEALASYGGIFHLPRSGPTISIFL